MARPHPITTKPGRKPGELIMQLPAGWDLRLRRVLRTILAESLPDPREAGLSPAQRESRIRLRRQRLQQAVCTYLTDLLTSDIVGKEFALASRSRHGVRGGSLREHVQAMLREVSGR
jgi:hypothetical protein